VAQGLPDAKISAAGVARTVPRIRPTNPKLRGIFPAPAAKALLEGNVRKKISRKKSKKLYDLASQLKTEVEKKKPNSTTITFFGHGEKRAEENRKS